MGAEDHGKVSTYNNYKCRCQPCRDANAAYQRKRRSKLSPEEKLEQAKTRKANRVYRQRQHRLD